MLPDGSFLTVLATWYKTFEYRWMGVPPVLLAWKVGLLIPPVFVAQNSFGQSVGIALVEAGYGLFLIITEPCIAPMADVMYKIGITHQMFFLAFQNLDTHYRYHGRGSLGGEMVATTSIYLLACLACILWSKIAPAVLAQRKDQHMQKFFEKVGMRFSRSTALYVVPRKAGDGAVPSEAAFVGTKVIDHDGLISTEQTCRTAPGRSIKDGLVVPFDVRDVDAHSDSETSDAYQEQDDHQHKPTAARVEVSDDTAAVEMQAKEA